MTQTTSPVRPVGAPGAPAAEAPKTPAARVQDSATRAATAVDGVHALGSPGGRALVRALGRVPGGRPTYGSGVSVEVGPKAVAVDVSLVLEYGAKAVDVADRVPKAVEAGVSEETGLDLVDVNVTVADVHHPSDDVAPEPEPAVDEAVDAAVDDAAAAADAVQAAAARATEPADAAPSAEEPPDALPVDLEQHAAEEPAPTPDRPAQQDDGTQTVVVLESGSDGDAPKVVQADEVVIADRVVVVGDRSTDRPSS